MPGVPLAFVDDEKFLSWGNFFFVADRLLKLWERHGSRSLRTRAIRRAEQWILARTRHSDGLGAIYPSDDVRGDGAGSARVSPGSSRCAGSHAPVHEPDDRRSSRFLLPAVLFAGLGHGHRGARSGRIGMAAAARVDARGRLAAFEGSAPQRRLEHQAAERRAFGLVFRVRQRMVSRYRRHRAGAAGAFAIGGFRSAKRSRRLASAPSTGCWRCKARTADGRRSMSTTTGIS